MSSICESPQSMARALTRASLALLDVSFEPASVCCGERFDHVVEALSDEVSGYASALLADQPQPLFRAPDVPPVPSAVTRRAQAALREAVEEGRLPGSTRSVTACAAALRRIADAMDDVTRCDPALFAPSLCEALKALERLVQVVEGYAHSHRRLALTLSSPGCSRTAAADAATRTERALLRCLDRTGDTRTLR